MLKYTPVVNALSLQELGYVYRSRPFLPTAVLSRTLLQCVLYYYRSSIGMTTAGVRRPAESGGVSTVRRTVSVLLGAN